MILWLPDALIFSEDIELKMENTLIFVDDGFFGLVKKNFQEESGKPKKYLQSFRNICKKENLNLKHLYIYTAPPYQSSKPNKIETRMMSKYQSMTKMLRKKKWITLRAVSYTHLTLPTSG